MVSFPNDTQIECVNIKFTTSILNETITKLTLLQYAEVAENRKDPKVEQTSSASTKNDAKKLTKFATDVKSIKSSFYKIIAELENHQNFSDFSGVSAAVNELNFLIEYNLNKTKFKEQSSALHKIEEDIANHRTPIATVDESIIKCATQNRFLKTWEKARRDQNDHFYRMLIGSLQDEIDKCSKKMECEKRCILEVESYSVAEMRMHQEESARWSEKFDFDLNKTEIDIQVATAETEGMKRNYEKTVEAIKRREQEMIDFVALKEERNSEKDSYLMNMVYKHKDHLFTKCHIFSGLMQ